MDNVIKFTRNDDGTYELIIEDKLVGTGFSFAEVLSRIEAYDRHRITTGE